MDDTWLALTQLARLTPGLRVLAISASGPSWRVTRACGELVSIPMGSTAALPLAPTEFVMVERPLYDTYAFDTAAGQRCSWSAVYVPTATPSLWLVMGVPASTRPEMLTAPRTVAALMGLALRHHSAEAQSPTQPAADSLSGTRPAPPDPIRSTAAASIEGAAAKLDLERITEAVRQAGDEMLQQLTVLLRHQDVDQTDGDTQQQQGRHTAEMVNDISDKVTHRVTAALARTRVGAAPILEQDPPRDATSEWAVQGSSARPANQICPGGQATDEPSTPPASVSDDGLTGTSTTAVGYDPLPRFSAEELQAAVDADEIVMRYQPIMSSTGDGCTGVEALPRWQHPHHGLLRPAQFLHHTTDSAGTRAIGTHVLRQAVTEGSRWHQQFPDRTIPVHVNVSGYQLDDHAFAATVRDCLKQSALPAPSLVLEVTGDPTSLSQAARTQLHAVAADGVQIAVSLDEPPTSNEGISKWRDLPVNIVKLNGAAATQTQTHTRDRPETILEMARRLGLRTVAERVEDTGQRDRLRNAGADNTQGHLHAPPIPAEALADWLRRRQRSETATTERASAVLVDSSAN